MSRSSRVVADMRHNIDEARGVMPSATVWLAGIVLGAVKAVRHMLDEQTETVLRIVENNSDER